MHVYKKSNSNTEKKKNPFPRWTSTSSAHWKPIAPRSLNNNISLCFTIFLRILSLNSLYKNNLRTIWNKSHFLFCFFRAIYIYIYKNLRRVLINYTFWIWFVRWGHECSTMVCVKQTIFENAWKYIKIIYFYI